MPSRLWYNGLKDKSISKLVRFVVQVHLIVGEKLYLRLNLHCKKFSTDEMLLDLLTQRVCFQPYLTIHYLLDIIYQWRDRAYQATTAQTTRTMLVLPGPSIL